MKTVGTIAWLLSLLCGVADAGNFVGAAINTPPEFIQAAEEARIKSAEYWIGRRLPDWPDDCVVRWKQRDSGGGGSASFDFTSSGIARATLYLHGTREAVLRDVIPHEVDHLVRATIIRRRIPRLLDEGAACMFERGSDPATYVKSLQQNADTVALWENIDADEYPQTTDVGPFYGFGVSVTEFLIERHGKTKTLELMRGTPSARWEAVLGEPIAETQRQWTAYFRGQISKPVIRMFSTPWCGPCLQFWREYIARSPGLPYVVVKELPPLIGGPQSVPAFVAPDGAKAIGFSRGWANWDAWARSHIPSRNWQPSADAGQPAAAESGSNPQGETQDASTQPVASEIQRYERDAIEKLRAELDALRKQQAAMQDAEPPRGQPPPGLQGNPSSESEQSTGGTRERTVSPPAGGVEPDGSASADVSPQPQNVDTTDEPVEPVDTTRERIEDGADKAVSLVDAIVSNPLVSTAIVGATGGTGAAGLAAWQMLMGYRRKKKQQPAPVDEQGRRITPQPHKAHAESPPSDAATIASLQQRIASLTAQINQPPRFVEVPVDRWNSAFAWAKQQMAADKPQTIVGHFDRLESLMRQFVAAQKGAQ